MRIAVLGASGRTGKPFVEQALAQGHQIVALVRNPDKIKEQKENLEVVKVDIYDADSLAKTLKGCDCVVSCLGVDVSLTAILWSTTFYSKSILSITEAVRKAGVERLVVITSWFTEDDPESPAFARWFLKPILLGRILTDMAVMERHLAKTCSDLNYTVVRPPGLRDFEPRGGEFTVLEGKTIVPGPCSRCLPRPDLARFMLQIVQEATYLNKIVAMTLSAPDP